MKYYFKYFDQQYLLVYIFGCRTNNFPLQVCVFMTEINLSGILFPRGLWTSCRVPLYTLEGEKIQKDVERIK